MRLTQIIEYMNAVKPSRIHGWPFSHLEITPSLKRMRAEYQRRLRAMKKNKDLPGS